MTIAPVDTSYIEGAAAGNISEFTKDAILELIQLTLPPLSLLGGYSKPMLALRREARNK
jgi:hypothetical protein